MGRKVKPQRKAINKDINNDNNSDNSDNDEVYDEIDRFHRTTANNDQKLLNINTNYYQNSSKSKEILNVEGDISSDDNSADNTDNDSDNNNNYDSDKDSLFDDSDDDDNDNKKQREEDSSQKDLINKWGSKRQAYYKTSYVDADFGGIRDVEEEKLIEYEQEDALLRQQLLNSNLNTVNFNQFIQNEDETKEDLTQEKDIINFAELNDDQKLAYFMQINGEFSKIVEEYKDKRIIMNTKLLPIYNAIKTIKNNNDPRTVFEQQIYSAISLFSSYLLNILFYMCLKSKTSMDDNNHMLPSTKNYTDQHPVIDAIIAQRKKITIVEEYLERNSKRISNILQKLQKEKTIKKIFAQSMDIDNYIKGIKNNNINNNYNNNNNITCNKGISTDNHALSPNNNEKIMDNNDELASDKRAITSQIEKNKGLTMKRKKGNQHSRIKKRKQYEKCLIKKRSQKSDHRKELKPYSGEQRGIRISTIKSIKLKA